MNWPKLWVTNGQQAPDKPDGRLPPWSTVRQAVRSAPTHTAWKNAQLSRRGTPQASAKAASTVKVESAGVANRFLRTHAVAPTCDRGASCASAISVRTQERSCSSKAQRSLRAILALNQFMNSDVVRLMPR